MGKQNNSEVKFESIIQTLIGIAEEPVLVITNVKIENNMTYFKCLGQDFQTFADKIIHSKNPLFDSSYVKFLSSSENDPEGIEKNKLMMLEVDNEMEQWTKHRTDVLKIVVIAACETLIKDGEEAFVDYLDQFFFITPEDLAKEMMQKLES